MKKVTFIILFLIISQFVVARKDSLRFSNFKGFYFNTYNPGKEHSFYVSNDKYSNDYFDEFEIKYYKFQTPGFGIGGVINKNGWFVKGDLNYWYGSKQLDDYFNFNLTDKTGKDPYTSFPILTSSGQLQGSNQPVGYQYYRIKDHYTGKVNFQYLDFSLALTGNITRFFRIYSGFRCNILLQHRYKAKIDREASLYEVKRYNSQYYRVDSLIQTENLQFKNGEVDSKSVQSFSSYLFFNIGFNVNFRIKKELFMIDCLYETSRWTLSQSGPIAQCVTFKLGYVFKYSTDFNK